jgi:cytosine/adenosine deaminase-related metal-dependent hydrolase
MSFQKFSARLIFDGRTFLTDTVLIIDENGNVQDLVKSENGGEDIQHLDGILVPGFINAHCHLELSHLKDKIPEGCGFVPFLKQVVRLRTLEEENISLTIEQAEAEMLEAGIVAVGDICNTADTILQKSKKNLYYHSFIETIGFNNQFATSIYAVAKNLKNAFASCSHQESLSIAPHAPYSVHSDLFAMITANEQLVSIHNQEDEAENRFFRDGSGSLPDLYNHLKIDITDFSPTRTSSLQAIWKHFHNQQQVLLVHNVATTRDDIIYIAEQQNAPQVFWCLCPNANLYITGNLPDVPLLMQHGKMIIGTDSLASNHQLSILEEMKTLQQHFRGISLQQLLQWATFNGAVALNIVNRFGSFEKGKQPGAVLIERVAGNSLKEATVRRIV